jgi:hypothetical protein
MTPINGDSRAHGAFIKREVAAGSGSSVFKDASEQREQREQREPLVSLKQRKLCLPSTERSAYHLHARGN